MSLDVIVKHNSFEQFAQQLEKIDKNGAKYFNSLPQEVQRKVLELLLYHDNERFQRLSEILYKDAFYMTPPTIEEFLNDPYFFGKLVSGMFPKWKENLIEKVFHPSKNVTEIILTGAIGGGKSYFMRVVQMYLVTKLLCLRNPNRILGIADGDNIVIGFFNVTVRKAYTDQFIPFQQLMLRSPFIRERALLTRKIESKVNPETPFRDSTIMFALGSSAVHALGQNTISCQLDEANFSSRRRLNYGEIERAMETYQAIKNRISSRFEAKMRIFYHYFIMMIASSKTFSNSFVDAHIEKVRNDPHTLIFDYSEWDVKPPETYERDEHGNIKMFRILVGDKRIRSRILEDDEVVSDNVRVIQAPLSLKPYAEYDLEEFLRSRAGIVTFNEKKFIPRDDYVEEIFKNSQISNPFISDSVECSLGESTPLASYLKIDEITVETPYGRRPKINPSYPRYVHIDLSRNHDYTGFCMGTFYEFRESLLQKGVYNPCIYIDMACRFEYKQSEIDYERIRNFIYYLNDVLGFQIKQGLITFDQFQSTDSIQILNKKGYRAELLPKNADIHSYLKSAILGRYIVCHRNLILYKEVLNLERDSNGVVQKPLFNMDGTSGTDDVVDAVSAVCYHIITNYQFSQQTNESINSFGNFLKNNPFFITPSFYEKKLQATIYNYSSSDYEPT